jgi:hypothetical protein
MIFSGKVNCSAVGKTSEGFEFIEERFALFSVSIEE